MQAKSKFLGGISVLQEEAVEIALAQKEDYNEIISVSDICFRDSQEEPETLRNLLLISTTYVAKVKCRIVGTVSYTDLMERNGKVLETPQHRRNRMYHIWGVAVLPQYRNVGIANTLVRVAERDMRRKKGKGYFGNAYPEEVAQWWVRTFGVRLKRLALDRLTTFGIPFEKKFHQDGFSENLKEECRKQISHFLSGTYTRAKIAWLRRSQKNKPR